jgi:hypothetical protein
MKVYVVVDILCGDEGNPGIRVFDDIQKAQSEVERLTAENADELGDTYLVVGPEELEVE